MARLNTHLSATPQQTRSSTVDSLYRDPSIAPRNASTARTASYSVMSPTASQNSDKENQPLTRDNTPQPAKRKGLQGASARMPTPDSGSATGGNGNKRRRTGDYSPIQAQIYEDDMEEEHDIEEDSHEDVAEEPPQAQVDAGEEEENLRFYDPNQDPDKRRQLRASMREHQRMVDGASRFHEANVIGSTNRPQIIAMRSSNQTACSLMQHANKTPCFKRCDRRPTLS
jgi:hypothetical protein